MQLNTDPASKDAAESTLPAPDFANNSLTKMVKAGVIKRTNSGMQIQIKNIHDKLRPDGTCWNRRDMKSEKTLANIASLVRHLGRGGIVPAIEVMARPGGGVEKIDGYCRTEAFRAMDASGEGDLWVSITPFEGTELEALARTESSNRDSKLTPIEQLDLYTSCREMLKAEGKKGTLAEIADVFDCSRQYIDQIFKLEKLDDEGRDLVASGKAKVADAIKAVRETKGGDAKSATDALKKKSQPKPVMPSGEIMSDLYGTVQAIRSGLGKSVNKAVGEFLKGERKGTDKVEIEVGELGRLMAVLAEGERQKEAKEARAKEKAEKARQEAMASDDLKQGEAMPDLGESAQEEPEEPVPEPEAEEQKPAGDEVDLSFL